MPRQRGAADQRDRFAASAATTTTRLQAAPRRSSARDTHAVAEPTTDSLQLFINQAMRYPLLTAEEEVELAQRIERGDLAAKERLINSNLRLVIKFARRYQGHGLPLGDLVQEAMLGLIRAAEKFDWRRGYKFSTYAVLWIKQSIQRGLDNTGRAGAHPGAHRAARADRQPDHHRADGEAQPRADRRGGREEGQAPARRGDGGARPDPGHDVSLDAPVGDEGDTTLGELHAESTADLEDEVLEREQEQAVGTALAKLPEDERHDHRGALRHRRRARGSRSATRPASSASPRRARASSRPGRCAAWPPTTRSPAGAQAA